jgi:signal recognition particle subunit SRP54
MFETLTQRLTQSFAFLRGQRELTEANLEEGLRQVRQALLEADVHYQVAKDLTERVRQRIVGEKRIAGVDATAQFVHAFHQELVQLLGPQDARIEFAKNGPTVVLLAGLQGSGKTTTCAKLAKHFREKHGKRPLLVAADVKRPAAVEQLRVLGAQIGVPVYWKAGQRPPDLCLQGVAHARVAGADFVLLDTAGRLHVDEEMMQEVVEIASAVRPTDTVLVVDAMTGQDAVNSAKAFHERLALTGVILTKLDGDARGGAAVSLQAVTGAPILFAGVGEKIDDLDAFQPERMAGRILGMGDVVGLVERAQASISETEAQASFEKMVLGSFTLEDMLAQLRMVRRLGPMKKVLGMMPGLSQLGDLDVDDKQMNRLEALFTSMTPRERIQPDLLDMSRRRRIARGSGQELGAVNELLKRYKEMKLVMRQMSKLGLGAKLGAREKRASLAAMSQSGELAGAAAEAAPGARAGGFPGLPGGLGGSGLDRAGGLAGFFGGSGSPRPMGSSATRQSGSKRKDKKKRKKRR